MSEPFEINGVVYVRKPEPTQERGRRIPAALMGMMLMFDSMGYAQYNTGPKRKRPDVHVPTEYGLIQQKKSKLSKRERDYVVRVFEENYVKLDEIIIVTK